MYQAEFSISHFELGLRHLVVGLSHLELDVRQSVLCVGEFELDFVLLVPGFGCSIRKVKLKCLVEHGFACLNLGVKRLNVSISVIHLLFSLFHRQHSHSLIEISFSACHGKFCLRHFGIKGLAFSYGKTPVLRLDFT